MPIRLNLLAEAQAAEELRRRDPVKRFSWAAVLIVLSMLVWSSSLQVKAFLVKSQLGQLESQMTSRTNEYQQVLAHQQKAAELHDKQVALNRLSQSRFLNGTLLNALQQATVEDVSLLRLRLALSYAATDEVKAHTNESRVLPGKPATATENIVLALDGSDSSPNPGDAINHYKQAVASQAYFVARLGKTNEVRLSKLSPLQLAPLSGKPSVNFTLECRYPEKTR